MPLDAITQFELIVIAGSVLGVWLKHQADYGELKGRVATLEKDNSEIKTDIKSILKDVQEIKLLLARNQIDRFTPSGEQ